MAIYSAKETDINSLVKNGFVTLTDTTTMLNLSQAIGTFLSIPEPDLVTSKLILLFRLSSVQ